MKTRNLLAAIAASVFSVAASANTLKPGLWEVTNRMEGLGDLAPSIAQAQRDLANLPPEQRKMMEQMMAKNGVQMGGAAPGNISTRVCMTKDMVERNDLPAGQGQCRTTNQQRSGNTMKFAFSCTNPPSSGEGQYTFVSAEAYSVRVNVKTAVDGRPQTMSMDGSGKWLGADCGNLKPPVAPAKK